LYHNFTCNIKYIYLINIKEKEKGFKLIKLNEGCRPKSKGLQYFAKLSTKIINNKTNENNSNNKNNEFTNKILYMYRYFFLFILFFFNLYFI
jgi:hypothetical protein